MRVLSSGFQRTLVVCQLTRPRTLIEVLAMAGGVARWSSAPAGTTVYVALSRQLLYIHTHQSGRCCSRFGEICMLRGIMTAIVGIILPLNASATTVTGTVVDPQDRVIQGAAVVLTCEEHSERAKTDVQGGFMFVLRLPPKSCSLSVTYPGFAPYNLAVSDAPPALIIRLQLALTREVVNVFPRARDLTSIGRASLASSSISEAELRTISNDSADLVSYAKQVAGTTFGEDRVYVNGLPSSSLPPADMIGRITVNADPFSAEYSDSDQNHIDITTKTPDRKVRFHFGGASLGGGGHSILAPGLRSTSRSGSWGVTFPVPRSPLVFSIHTALTYDSSDQPIQAAALQIPAGASHKSSSVAPVRNAGRSVLVDAYYSKSDTLKADFSFLESRTKATNTGTGGLAFLETGANGVATVREARAMLAKTGERYSYNSLLVVRSRDFDLWANSRDLGVRVFGGFDGGGATFASDSARGSGWTWKNAVQSSSTRRFFNTGVTVSRFNDFDYLVPNPAGVIRFENLQAYADSLAGAKTGTWFPERGDARVSYASSAVSPFVQGELLRSDNAVVTGGIRADYQTKGGVLFSPRLSAAGRLHGFVVRAGGGMFVDNWSHRIFVTAMEYDGIHIHRYVLRDRSLADAQDPGNSGGPFVLSRISPDLVRPRDIIFRGSLERSMGSFTAGAEYTWTEGVHLLGSRRLATESGWEDLLESNRRLRRHRLHARLGWDWKGQNIVGHYEWIHSRDNTDGASSFPERQDELHGEWGRSTRVPVQNLTLVGNIKFPGAVSLKVVETFRGSVPYDITSGRDLAQNGLFNDRAGRPRNSGNGPTFNSLALYGHRRIPLPKFLVRSKEKIYLDVGVRMENVLNTRNYSTLGSVIGSPFFGKPLTALPGRSLRIWFNWDR